MPLSESGGYWIDYPLDYALSLDPDIFTLNKPYILIIFKLDKNLNLYLNPDNSIAVQHINITQIYKKKVLEYIKNFNKEKNGKCEWDGTQDEIINFYF